MISEAFSEFADFVPERLMLLSLNGCFLAVNRAAAQFLDCEANSLVGQRLADAVTDSEAKVAEILVATRRTSAERIAALRFRAQVGRSRVHCRVIRRAGNSDGVVLLRISSEDSLERFTLLSRKLDELTSEVSRRRKAEDALRDERDLAAFGRDVGLAVVGGGNASEMLQQCAQLLVDHLDSAFARIWVADPDTEELMLAASAGIYTHLDGGHSRIRMGQYKIGKIAQERRPHLTNQVIGDERVHDQAWAKRENMVAFAGYPLVVDSRTVGVMAMFARHTLSQSVLSAMESVANSIALGIERHRIEAQLTRTAELLQHADQRKNEFLAMLAHELRNPLMPVQSGIDLLRIETGDSETLTVMKEQIAHVSRLVDDLMDVARIMQDRIELRPEAMRLDERLDTILAAMRPAAEARKHTLTWVREGGPIWVTADPVRVEQMITNLVGNAIRYTPLGGRIEVSLAVEEERATIRVRDTGVGIAAEFLPMVFDLFSQAEPGLARTNGGLGIGLTLVRRLARLHGGDVTVRSDGEGRGSVFSVWWPAGNAPKKKVAEAGVARPKLDASLRVLVVDDHVDSATVFARLLAAVGVRNCRLAHDGPEALTAAEEFLPHYVFLDLGLPGLSGFEVAERFRADARLHRTTLVAVTGYGSDDDRRKSREAGFDHHFTKPIAIEGVVRLLSESELPPVDAD